MKEIIAKVEKTVDMINQLFLKGWLKLLEVTNLKYKDRLRTLITKPAIALLCNTVVILLAIKLNITLILLAFVIINMLVFCYKQMKK